MIEQQEKFLNEILNQLPDSSRRILLQELSKQIDLRSTQKADAKFTDKSLTGPESYVFLWKDLVELDAVVDGLANMTEDPVSLLSDVKKLLGFWARLRAIRVEISEPEARVLRAIRRGNKTIDKIVASTGLNEADCKSALASLSAKKYLDNTSLITCTNDEYSTIF